MVLIAIANVLGAIPNVLLQSRRRSAAGESAFGEAET
jgi:hypothetical protein